MALAGHTRVHKTSQNLKALDALGGLEKTADGSQGRGYSFARRKKVTTVTRAKSVSNLLKLKDKNVTFRGSQRVTKKVTFSKSLFLLSKVYWVCDFQKGHNVTLCDPWNLSNMTSILLYYMLFFLMLPLLPMLPFSGAQNYFRDQAGWWRGNCAI